ncbi:methyltransferase regulatory domain-containing protein [Campylobacter suis]|uniref:SAM-dependent methyltransferase n=1 Tax=Campylobacter suis TaxID=2790657 RepID=A0ABM8Q0C5_9BACT|nr:methyltransferase regulatory domain-containing protein [Campylobacter suis]CAD7286239.1 putative protein RP789 [Campylobacter suis]
MQSFEVKSSYDEMPYFSAAFHDSSVLRLHAIGKFLRLEPTPVRKARVLELGGAFGGNIMPLAVAYPDAEVVGVDISSIQVNTGNAIAKQMGIENFHLIEADIMALSPEQIKELGKFDYIIAHGFYSWVRKNVRDAFLALTKTLLKQNGIAFISYNVYPGWKSFDTLRDYMMFCAKDKNGIKRLDVAKRELNFMGEFLRMNFHTKSNEALKQTQELLLTQLNFVRSILKDSKNDYYILHEFFETTNEAQLFYKFANRLSDFGLGYLVESTLDDVFAPGIGVARFDRHINKTYKSRIDREQMRDFFLNRSFRKSLVMHEDELNEESETNISLDEISLIHIIAKLEKTKDGYSINDEPLSPQFNEIFAKIYDAYPASISIDELGISDDNINAFLALMANPATLLSTQKFSHIKYEKGKTRLKPRVAGYLRYFANTHKPVMLLATQLNSKTHIDTLGARTALLFDGQNSFDDIVKELEKIYEIYKNEPDAKHLNEFNPEIYASEVAKKLENSYFLEKF